MMCEIIYYRHAAYSTAHLHAPLHALELRHRVRDSAARHPQNFAGRDNAQAVSHVEEPRERRAVMAKLAAFDFDGKPRHLARKIYIGGAPSRSFFCPEAFHATE